MNPKSRLVICALAALACAPLVHSEPLVKPGETIAFLGDSITQAGNAAPGGYIRLVESGLAANGLEIKVVPAGISGHKSDQMRGRLEADVLSKKPDWMTLSCGVNDVWHGERGVSLEDYKINITDIVDRCEKAGVKVIILTSTQIRLPLDNAENTKLAAYNAFLRELAKERGLPLADLNADMAGAQKALAAAGSKSPLTTDGVHMNHLGNLMMARGVLRAFGLEDAHLTVAEAKWQTFPNAVPLRANLKVSYAEMERLEALAAAHNQAVGAFVDQQLSEALKAIVGGAPEK
jgi:lysophospholipase L1-like esterase